ncbi:MAG: 2-phospho-L-lactate transferase [Archaeoglobales archaeon]|jgi:LPPG:FO 2-phospho-L-lactate transferase|nr:2-phospho-L-lactate transferase [Archaeoglobales archaeon]TDA25709.1 MAG: 2-phospho-L-lactate transferase [Archaeoglobi archaeon]TDA30148.1 MAG: 2-phospho-L-lactate transferase [Archaeoglobi archaeon]
MIVLSGGTGTPKLLMGLKEIADFSVVVNTAEDIWISGNKICPDIDSVIYALAGIIDEEKWWGIRGDTFRTSEMLKNLGFEELMKVGDLDRATHILRSELLRNGLSLVQATKAVARAYGVSHEVFPMCNEDVATTIVTPRGEMHFQEFWVKEKGLPEVLDIYFRGIERARIPEEVRKLLKDDDEILIGPSNPITSILPILSVEDFRNRIRGKKVIAVSPIIGDSPVSGPAGKFMKAKGYEVSPLGVLRVYGDLISALVVDERDSGLVSEKIFATKTIMRDKDDAIRLSEYILKLFDRL